MNVSKNTSDLEYLFGYHITSELILRKFGIFTSLNQHKDQILFKIQVVAIKETQGKSHYVIIYLYRTFKITF